MAKTQLFIPEKIKVGYVKRSDTYTGQLAYVIYYDAKGVLRKQKSWDSWRNHEIEPQEFENKPHGGFILNKDVQRCNWSHFGSNRSYIRIYDDRGIEFEITPENLLGILTDTDCIKRQLNCEFVYAWSGTELLILPCHTEEYKEAQQYTELQGMSISARDLKVGCSYMSKKQEEFIYLGRYPWCKGRDRYYHYGDEGKPYKRKFKNEHLFARWEVDTWGSNKGKGRWIIEPKSSMNFLAQLNSEEQVQNYAELMDKLRSDVRASKVKGVEIVKKRFKPVQLNIGATEKEVGYSNMPHAPQERFFFKKEGDKLKVLEVVCRYSKDKDTRNKIFQGYSIVPYKTFNTEDWSWNYSSGLSRHDYHRYSYGYRDDIYNSFTILDESQTVQEVKGMGDAMLNLETGQKAKFEDLINL